MSRVPIYLKNLCLTMNLTAIQDVEGVDWRVNVPAEVLQGSQLLAVAAQDLKEFAEYNAHLMSDGIGLESSETTLLMTYITWKLGQK